MSSLNREQGQLYATASQSHGRFAYPSCSRPDIGYGGGSASITAASSSAKPAAVTYTPVFGSRIFEPKSSSTVPDSGFRILDLGVTKPSSGFAKLRLMSLTRIRGPHGDGPDCPQSRPGFQKTGKIRRGCQALSTVQNLGLDP